MSHALSGYVLKGFCPHKKLVNACHFADKKLKFLFISQFEQFVFRNGGVLWRPQLLQQKLMKLNIGKIYWENKMEQYRVTREQLNITQL